MVRVSDVYSCNCKGWLNENKRGPIRTCTHLKKLRGDEVENARVKAGKEGRSSAPWSGPQRVERMCVRI